MTKLTAKQEQFCREYLIDLNASAAAVRAGYSEKTAGTISNENMQKPAIASRIAELKAERCAEAEIDALWVLKQAVKVHKRCMQEEAVTDRDGAVTGEYKFEHSGANKALEIIGKHVDIQAFLDRQEIQATVTHEQWLDGIE
jgi:phage terminase small subunit